MSQPVPTSCPLCNAQEPKATGRTHVSASAQGSGEARGGTTTYTQYGCGTCLVQFWWPLKNPGAEWYRTNEKYGTRNADPVWNANTNHKKTLSFLQGHKGSVLDVGCGIGNFLSLAKEKGWKISGIDFDPDAVDAAKRVTHVDDFETTDVVTYMARHPERRFELITFFDVLEHVDNHNEFMASVQSLLKPGGHIAMSMPYRKHARWLMKADLPPMHLTCWDRESLKRFLKVHGFDVVYMRRSSEGIWPIVMKLRFKYGNWSSLGAVNVARRASGNTITSPRKRPGLVRAVHLLAKTKDAVLFGIPAFFIWLVMLPTPKRYIDLFAIARMRI
ncbi:MAG: class I SAM-dependent methyltransferase [bacterium]|nr:class I SAM-dependent methyltransferase [bacterium]